MSLPEFGGMDTGFNWYHDADPSEYDLLVSNSEGGLERLRELGARRAEAVFWGADPEFFAPQPVDKELRRLLLRLRRQVPARLDEGDGRRAVARAARRRLRARRPRLPGRHRQRAARRRHPVQRLRASDLGGAHQPVHHAPLARDGLRVVVVPAVRARLGRCRDRLEPVQRPRALVRAGLGAARRRRRRRGRRGVSRAARRPGAGRGAGPPRARARARRAHVPPPCPPAARRCVELEVPA